jgi:hypothetical protein
MSPVREDFAGGSAVLMMVSDGLEIALPDFEAENTTPMCEDLRQVVEVFIGGVPTVLEISLI